MNNISNCADGCNTVGSHKAKICLPVSVIPYAITSPAIVNCCGDTRISSECDCNCKEEQSSCQFVISQVINVDVPVEFGASVKIGETYIECNIDGDFNSFIASELEDCECDEGEFPNTETEETDDKEFFDEDLQEDFLGV